MKVLCMRCLERMRFKAKICRLFKDVAIYRCEHCYLLIAVSIPKKKEAKKK